MKDMPIPRLFRGSIRALLNVGARYRALAAPLDVVVQDWQYWRPSQWGSHEFDPARYTDPQAMIAALHEEHLHAAVSVWPRFDPSTNTLAQLDRVGAAA
jgi:alpha-D-xyloside xylohydrolase